MSKTVLLLIGNANSGVFDKQLICQLVYCVDSKNVTLRGGCFLYTFGKNITQFLGKLLHMRFGMKKTHSGT